MLRASKKRISLALLVGFEAAARTLSFTKAAKEISLTQSAMSRQIKSLEEQLDKVLFRRINRGLVLTEEGEWLYASVSSALKLIADSVDRIDGRRARICLNVAAPALFATFWLAPKLAQYLELFPGCDVRVITSSDPDELLSRSADLGFWHFGRNTAPDDQPLAIEEVTPVCSPTLLANSRHLLSDPQDLSHQVLLQFENVLQQQRRVDWFRWLSTFGLETLEPSAKIGFSQYDQAIQAAVSGNGVALGRLPLVTTLIRSGVLVAPFPKLRVTTGAWHILVAPSSVNKPEVKHFVNWCRTQAAKAQ